jgi:protoheme IX farnesyltransferase
VSSSTYYYHFVSVLGVLRGKLHDYAQLGKLRLSITVVFSAGMAFLISAPSPVNWGYFFVLVLCGLSVTLSASAFNEVLEVKYDGLMTRTAKRPLPAGRMSVTEALFFACLTGVVGVAGLYAYFNPLTAFMGAASVLLYAFVYTPLKRVGRIAVFVGAIPGALPAIIGYVAANGGDFDLTAGLLFAIQFFWQLPHFWAIAWIAAADYERAGFRLGPFGGKLDRWAASQILLANLILLLVSVLPGIFNLISGSATLGIGLCGILFLLPAVKLYSRLDRASALQLMFASFLYLPAVFIIFLLGLIS